MRMAQDPEAFQQIVVSLTDKVDIYSLELSLRRSNASLETRGRVVVQTLQAKAASTQGPLLSFIQTISGVEPYSVQPIWIVNAVVLRANHDAIAALSNRTDIEWIDWEAPMELDMTTAATASIASANGHENGHTAIHAPEMWKLGYTGYGRVAYIIDSGVQGTHPALKAGYLGNFKPGSQAWYSNNGTTFPADCDPSSNHGSHVTGTIMGLNPATRDTIGVAPGGLWMAAPAIGCGNVSTVASFQFALNPDNNSNTTDDIPDAINNSWNSGTGGQECTSTTRDALVALEAAGVAVVFAAGNDGPGVSTITSPKNINVDTVNVFCVAMVNGNNNNYPVDPGSSRGPSLCPAPVGTLTIKPEVSAPGVNVRSAGPNGGYQLLTGTSMASPHATGAVLLLKEAFPYLTGREIKMALFLTADDLGTPGEDNDYGNGMINVLAAYNYLVSKGNTPVTVSREVDVAVLEVLNINDLNCTSSILPFISIKNQGTQPLTSLKMVYSYDGGTPDTFNWTGGLPAGLTQPILFPNATLAPGQYTLVVEAITVNGQNDYFYLNNKIQKSFTISGDKAPVTTNATVCAGSQALLTASVDTGKVKWYTNQTGGTLVSTGASLFTPALAANTTYYAAQVQTQNIGKSGNTGDLGNYENTLNNYMIFSADQSFLLKSVKIYANVAGLQVIVLRSASSQILLTKIVNVPVGESRVNLDFTIPAGQNLQLALNPGSVGGLYRSFSNLQLPYVIPGVLEIIGSNLDNSALKFYYFFYDWEIEYEGICGRTPATATVGAGTVAAAIAASATTINLQANPVVTFTDQSQGATSWLWNFGDGSTSTSQNPDHTFLFPGTYRVTLFATGSTGCGDADTLQIVAEGFPTAIDPAFAFPGKWEVRPNVGNDYFEVSYEWENPAAAQWLLTDLSGRQIKAGELNGKSGKFVLDLSAQPAGFYAITLYLNGQRSVQRITVTP